MDIKQVTVNGEPRFYDVGLLRGELRKLLVNNADINRIFGEIEKGDVSSLNRHGLGHYLVASPCGQLPPTAMSADEMCASLDRINTFNFLEVMKILHETSKQLREANREMRHADRDIAVAEHMAAAEKIRNAAIANIVFGIVQGAASIGMGIASVASASTQLKALKGATPETMTQVAA